MRRSVRTPGCGVDYLDSESDDRGASGRRVAAIDSPPFIEIGERSHMLSLSMPNVFTRDINVGVAFYRDLLGFSLAYQLPEDGQPEHVILRLGDSLLALSTDRAIAQVGLAPSSGNAFELVVWCDDVDRETSRLRAAGAAIVVEPYDYIGGHRRAYVSDPDGNWLALVEARS
jgi:lactoylglutathione lyase